MDRRSIDISVSVVRKTTSTNCILDILAPYAEGDQQTKVMIFYTTQKRTGSTLLEEKLAGCTLLEEVVDDTLLDKVRAYLGGPANMAGRGHALTFTGDTGVAEKSFSMGLFDGSKQCDICDLRVLVVVSAASTTYGICSAQCRCVIAEGLPRRMQDVAQHMCRAARNA